jgi:hypothetical protein
VHSMRTTGSSGSQRRIREPEDGFRADARRFDHLTEVVLPEPARSALEADQGNDRRRGQPPHRRTRSWTALLPRSSRVPRTGAGSQRQPARGPRGDHSGPRRPPAPRPTAGRCAAMRVRVARGHRRLTFDAPRTPQRGASRCGGPT